MIHEKEKKEKMKNEEIKINIFKKKSFSDASVSHCFSVLSCLYSAVILTQVREWCFKRMIYYYYSLVILYNLHRMSMAVKTTEAICM